MFQTQEPLSQQAGLTNTTVIGPANWSKAYLQIAVRDTILDSVQQAGCAGNAFYDNQTDTYYRYFIPSVTLAAHWKPYITQSNQGRTMTMFTS